MKIFLDSPPWHHEEMGAIFQVAVTGLFMLHVLWIAFVVIVAALYCAGIGLIVRAWFLVRDPCEAENAAKTELQHERSDAA